MQGKLELSYVYSNDRMQSVYLRDVHVGTESQIRSSATSLAKEAVLAGQERRGGGDSDDAALPGPSRPRGSAEEQRRQGLHAQQLQQQVQQHQGTEQRADQQHQLRQPKRLVLPQGSSSVPHSSPILARFMDFIETSAETKKMSLTPLLVQDNNKHSQPPRQSPRSTGPGRLPVRHQGPREQLVLPQGSPSVSPPSSSSSARFMDPIDALETKKISLTPLLLQDNNQPTEPPRQAPPRTTGPILTSEVMQRQEEDGKRTLEEIEALEEDARNKVGQTSGGRPQGGIKSHMGLPSGDDDSSREKGKKGDSGKLLGRLFDQRRDNHKGKDTHNYIDNSRPVEERSSEEPGRSSNHTDSSGGPQNLPRMGTALTGYSRPVSQHSSGPRQHGREQQALYPQLDLTRSPASPPEVQSLLQISPVNTGLRSNALTLPLISDGRRPRLLRGRNINGDGSSLAPELSVIRIFAGKKLETEETSRTVLLNSSTSSEELVKRAIQRFRLPVGEDATDYYLTVKRLEGSSATLHPEEKPLIVLETLAKAALDLPKLKGSSVGIVNSIASDLPQHPAIIKLSMNDFTDDAPVKIYLNRRSKSASNEGGTMEEGDTMSNESFPGDGETGRVYPLPPPHNLNTVGVPAPSERFGGSPSHFTLQLLIYQDDLPDDMVFDPLNEMVAFKNILRGRSQAATPYVPFHRKIFMLPKNITVAEVIEVSLEKFGIPGGIVDDSDEVENKNTKRGNSSRVRYELNVLVDGKGVWCLCSDCLSCLLSHFI